MRVKNETKHLEQCATNSRAIFLFICVVIFKSVFVMNSMHTKAQNKDSKIFYTDARTCMLHFNMSFNGIIHGKIENADAKPLMMERQSMSLFFIEFSLNSWWNAKYEPFYQKKYSLSTESGKWRMCY